MRNIKLEQHLDGDEHWPYMAMVTVPGRPSATSIPAGASREQTEAIIQTWNDIAILRVPMNIDVYFGFIIGDHAQFLNVPVITKDGQFGVHVGDSEVTFFVFAKDMQSRPTLELLEVTFIDNPQYVDLPLY